MNATSSRARTRKPRQAALPFRSHGGPRKGAGRRPKGDKAGVPHRDRAKLSRSEPVHVTVRLRRGAPRLRNRAAHRTLQAAFARACERGLVRVVHYSVQHDHLHLICEAHDRDSLARGMQGLLSGIARRLNRLWQRAGSLLADRYHDVVRRTPRQVRNALAYVLLNAKKHGLRLAQGIDAFTSAPWFDGWRQKIELTGAPARPVAAARTWLLRLGWRRRGLIDAAEVPG